MRSIITFILVSIYFFNISAYAIQIKSAKDNEKIDAIISLNELNRIYISGDRIQQARGLNGAYELIKDEKQGSIYIKPSMYYQHRGLNLFVTTEYGRNYNLFLTPKNTPAETINIKPLTPSNIRAEQWERNSPYIETITRLINGMINELVPEGYAVSDVNEVTRQIKMEDGYISSQRITIYQGKHLQGEIWLLVNKSKHVIELNARDFYDVKTRAISFEDDFLECNDETYLYRIVGRD